MIEHQKRDQEEMKCNLKEMQEHQIQHEKIVAEKQDDYKRKLTEVTRARSRKI
jgi:hypothetical protein